MFAMNPRPCFYRGDLRALGGNRMSEATKDDGVVGCVIVGLVCGTRVKRECNEEKAM